MTHQKKLSRNFDAFITDVYPDDYLNNDLKIGLAARLHPGTAKLCIHFFTYKNVAKVI
jgi:hypothetical protein